jgi:mono/diheme cytochrome c family protein
MIEHRLNNRWRSALSLGLAAGALLAVSGCTNDSGSASSANLVNGKQLFVQKCGACHILGRAGSKGVSGPNLDEAFASARQENWGDDGIRGVVYGQILYPNANAPMPANLVTGNDAADVAAYVSTVASKPGKDVGLLASAVAPAGGGKPAVEKNGVLSITADPNGQLLYVETTATGTPGPVKLEMPNESGVPHNVVIEDGGIETPVLTNGIAKASGTLKVGKFVYFCSVPGHREAGMVGKLTVR